MKGEAFSFRRKEKGRTSKFNKKNGAKIRKRKMK